MNKQNLRVDHLAAGLSTFQVRLGSLLSRQWIQRVYCFQGKGFVNARLCGSIDGQSNLEYKHFIQGG